jgi:hypothetical protein
MTKRQKYRVLVGINYPPNDKRAEPGAIVDDIPPSSIGWLLRDGIIEKIEAPPAAAETQKGGDL